MQLVNATQASPYRPTTAIITTDDENGGAWDHVAQPVVDRWGPGTRVPPVIVTLGSPRWQVAPLGTRDGATADLTAAFDFGQQPDASSAVK